MKPPPLGMGCLLEEVLLVFLPPKIFGNVPLRQGTAVVARGHNLAVGTSGEHGDEVAAACAVERDGLVEDIGGLADGADYVVNLLGQFAGEIAGFVVGIVEGWTDEVGHACIDDGKLLGGSLLDVIYTGDEGSALTYDGTAQLEVDGLSGTQAKVPGIGVEVCLEVGDGVGDRVGVVDAQSAADVDDFRVNVLCLQAVLQLVDAVGQRDKVVHVKDL